MVNMCLVCKSYCEKGQQRSFHRFPREPARLKLWLSNLGLKVDSVSRSATICSDHFSPNDFSVKPGGAKYVKVSAVPSAAKVIRNAFIEEKSEVEVTGTSPLSWPGAPERTPNDEIERYSIVSSELSEEEDAHDDHLKPATIPHLKVRPAQLVCASSTPRPDKFPGTSAYSAPEQKSFEVISANSVPERKSFVPLRTQTTLNIEQPHNVPSPSFSLDVLNLAHAVKKRTDVNNPTMEVQTDTPLSITPTQPVNLCTIEPINPVCVKLSEILSQLPVHERSKLEIEFLTKAYQVLNSAEKISPSLDSSPPPLIRLHRYKEELSTPTLLNRSKLGDTPTCLDPTSDGESRKRLQAQTYLKTFHNYCVPPKK